ncbi:hypothetical protein AVHM3334_15310 [Acidovorax sp. SUPP3334]|nr:hypothetical protein AVHM3334_15310 [Acidovorax sp. SUPP3334]
MAVIPTTTTAAAAAAAAAAADRATSRNPSRSPSRQGLGRTAANHVPLTPMGFLDRSAQVQRGDTVAILAPNTPAMLEAHLGIPLCGAAILQAIAAMGFDVDHVYGITEVSGTPVSCVRQTGWADLPEAARAKLQARQGVRAAALEDLRVLNPDTLQPVPADGLTAGEIMLRGNTVMKGYLKNPAATDKAFAGGWFHTGDIAVMHPDGYVQITDRSKDVIISGGENISSVEVEDVLHRHPAVLLAAVVAQPDERWGEVPCAFVELKPEAVGTVSAEELIAFCRSHLARFKCPRHVVFDALPRTATGKIQKFRLREIAGSREAITQLAQLPAD